MIGIISVTQIFVSWMDREENSMAFRPMKREDLETWLDEKGLKGKFRWFTGSVVDTLYELVSCFF